MFSFLVFLTVCFVAYSNGANDNFKGVASLFGSQTCGYRKAICWATVTTFAGSIAAIFFAHALLRKFSGAGLVPVTLTTSPQFIMAVALGAGVTVILAALLGFPISTTHGLIGALIGAGLSAVGHHVNLTVLGKEFLAPLLFSPLMAMALGAIIYLIFRSFRLGSGLTKEMCICVGAEQQVIPLQQPDGVTAAQVLPSFFFEVSQPNSCTQRYVGTVLGINVQHLLDTFHFLSGGAVSFARGLNDTPKMVALLLTATGLGIHWGFAAVAVAIAGGGLLNAKAVARTMSHKITGMNSGQGFSANLSTALLVTTASFSGLPVSTTHVSVGSLLGMGIITRQANWKPVLGVVASWIITLPCGAISAALAYEIIRAF